MVASYSIDPAIGNGLSFDENSGTISGTPTAVAEVILYTIKATNSGGTDTATVAITVNDAAPMITISPATVTATAGTAITPITIDSAGGTVASYSIEPAIGNGLSFDENSGTISGTPTAVAEAILYTIKATNSGGTDTATVAITVNDAAPMITISPATVTATAGTAITPITIDSAGGTVASYSIEPAIGNGLSFDENSGTISGTPTAVAEAIPYTITASNASGMNTAMVTITVNAAPITPVAAPMISISPATVTVIAGTAITDITIDSTGGAVDSYSISPLISNGLTFSMDTGTISGTPTAVSASTRYTITATNSSGSDTATLTITVNAAPVAAPSISISPATVTAIAGTAITPITIDSTSGGTVASYDIDPAIENGLTFDATTGTISGAPDAVAGSKTYTITATNRGGEDDATVAITVNAAPITVPTAKETKTVTVGSREIQVEVATKGSKTITSFVAKEVPSQEWQKIVDRAVAEDGIDLSNAPSSIDRTIPPTLVADTAVDISVDKNACPARGCEVTLSYEAGDVPAGKDPYVFHYDVAASKWEALPHVSRDTNARKVTALATSFSPFAVFSASSNKDAAPMISITPATVTATAGTAIEDITIASTGGAVDSYSIDPAIGNGLSFDENSGTISGTPTAEATETTYTITATNSGGEATATVAITVNAADTTPPTVVITSSSGASGSTVDAETLSYTATFNEDVTGFELSDITVTGTANGGNPGASNFVANADGTTFIFDVVRGVSDGTVIVSIAAAVAEDSAGNGNASNQYTLTIYTGLTPESARKLNENILPRLTHVMLGGTVSAVNSRMDDTFSGTPEVASYQFDGQTVQLDSQTGLSANLQNTVAQKLPNYIKSLKDGTMDWKEMLSRSAFVMPLNAAGGAGSTAGATVWGGGDYNRMSGKFSNGDWKGEVLSVQLGIDQRLGKDMLAGGLVSWSKGDVDYTLTDKNGKETRGDYTHQITSVHPYFARSNDEVDLWGSVGYGQGKLAIKQQSPTEDSERSSDTRLLSLSAGGSGRLTQSGLKLKSDIILAQVDIAASADKKIPADKLNSQRLRLLLEMGKERPLSSGGHFKPLLEVGLRYDGGVGESSGIGAVLNLGGHYANTTGLTVEGKLHTLLGQDEYQEWGIQGTIRQQANANGQGLSFSLNPSYGTVGISTNQVWQQELADDNNGTSTNSARLNVNMGYGLFTAGGLLTPYSEVSMSDSNHYRLGLRWKPSSPLSLHLYGERETSNNSDRILLEGTIRF